jgi:Spx/MgsR family transcriptional regulator
MSKSLRVFAYSKCSTCREALRFLKTHELEYSVHDITESPPSKADLSKALRSLGGELKKLFNTSGQQYRELGISEKLKAMPEAQALQLLAGNGRLIKRPLVIWEDKGQSRVLVGFKNAEWKDALL